MKRFIYILLFAIVASVSVGYAQTKKKHKPPTATQLAKIAELENELEQIRHEIMALENKFRASYLTEEEESALKATYGDEQNFSVYYVGMLEEMLNSEREAWMEGFNDELKRRLNLNGGMERIKMEVAEVTSKIQQGLADFSEYDKLFRRLSPDEKLFTYKMMQHEMRMRELESKIQKEKQRKMISDLKKEIYNKTGYRPSFNGEKLTKPSTDEGAYDFIKEIDKDREKFHGAPLTAKEKKELKEIRNLMSDEYKKAEKEQTAATKEYDFLKSGLEILKAGCKECGNQ